MAQLVLIDTGTLRYKDGKAINAIGDLVSIHEDDVDLTGPGYAGFKIVRVPGTAEEVMQRLRAKLPKTRKAFKSSAPAGKYTFDPPEEVTVWNDNGVWRKVDVKPKYQLNIAADSDLENKLTDKNLSTNAKLAALEARVTPTLAVKTENLAAITELSKSSAKE